MAKRRSFGTVRALPSGKFQGRYTGPDGKQRGKTFTTRRAAGQWLADCESEMGRQTWRRPEDQMQRLSDYAKKWLEDRDLKPRSRAHYQTLLDLHILPALGDVPLLRITPTVVRDWHSDLAKTTGKTMRAHAYGLLRTILGTAVTDDVLVANPCRIKGAGSTPKRLVEPETLTPEEIAALADAMPPRYRAMVYLAAWCAMRQGELFALRRMDLDLARGVVHIRRGVSRTVGEVHIGTPKSDAGTRDPNIPSALVPLLATHLAEHVGPGRDALLFPARNGGPLAPSTLYKVFYPAREKIGRPDLRFHDLRGTGATLAAHTGATLAELMARLGHSTPQAALRYQHVAQDRDRKIADALSAMMTGATVLPFPQQGQA